MTAFTVAANTTVNGLNLQLSDTLDIFGTAIATQNQGGQDIIHAGGLALNSTLSDSGNEEILSGGVSSNTSVDVLGLEIISAGGLARNITVNSGGELDIALGGQVQAATVNSGAIVGLELASGAYQFQGDNFKLDGIQFNKDIKLFLTATSGTSLNGFQDQHGLTLLSGSVANNTNVLSGGTAVILSGADANTIQVKNGAEVIVSGGSVHGGSVASGGSIDGLQLNHTSLNYHSGANLVVDGVNLDKNAHYNLLVASGGSINGFVADDLHTLTIANGGWATNTTINKGLFLEVDSGGVAKNITLNNGGILDIHGGTVTSGTVNSGGSINGLQLSSGTIYYHANANNIIDGINIHKGAELSLIVNSGAKIDGFALDSTHSLTLAKGGLDNHTAILNGGTEKIEAGGIASNGKLFAGGTEIIASGGVANHISLYQDSIIINQGGVASFDLASDWTQNFFTINNGTTTLNINHHNLNFTNSFPDAGVWNINDSANSHATINASLTELQNFSFAANDKDNLILTAGTSNLLKNVYDSIHAVDHSVQISYSTALSTVAATNLSGGAGVTVHFDGNGNTTFTGNAPTTLTAAENEIVTAYSHSTHGVQAGQFAEFAEGGNHYLFIISNSGENTASFSDSLIQLTGVSDLSFSQGVLHI